jgi:hypothetical protein
MPQRLCSRAISNRDEADFDFCATAPPPHMSSRCPAQIGSVPVSAHLTSDATPP